MPGQKLDGPSVYELIVSEGVTEKSVHGGATWIQMRLTFDDDAAQGGTA